ncbi:DUF1523 family protein [Marinovum sp. 2_MG-2023]|uniref:DUF1523 family protein n=1 Tax=Roseobacteraceae TaxID=2854170 RepID=UPI001FD3AA29|nr:MULTISPECIES: DUF1523 family protein [Roseobacteraceae]MCJ7874214.1 DUF1523 family protein [Phaeobacter sp. J2-8]MDO6730174.1 DUF1523 family protein [Marinovum sp. 2_MG-2023]MDO6778912.1 DUF1523 family protein [Marinovum sp. 1_MG-2023]
MRYLKWLLILSFWVLVAAFFHYTLPHHDIARISDTETRRVDFGENSIFWSSPDSGNATGQVNRDVFFIQAIRSNGRPMVYRNEDTGWGWPPYFKFDTANLQTEAADLRSTSENPKWVAIRHYGWRNEFLSIYPNAVSVRQVDGPDVRIIPWMSIVILGLAALVFWAIYVRWLRFRRRRIDPMLEDVEEGFADATDAVKGTGSRINKWFGGK